MILRGWKEIADYLGSGVRTVQRWEREGLPIQRLRRGPRGPVLADSERLDYWLRSSSLRGHRPDMANAIQRALTLKRQIAETRVVLLQQIASLKRELAVLRERRKLGKPVPGSLSGKDSHQG